MSLHVDLFWGIRSPYTYLGSERYKRIQDQYNVTFRVKVVLPGLLRHPESAARFNPLFFRYALLDLARVAAYHGLPFSYANPDPLVQDKTTMHVAAEQPHIHRLSRLAVLADRAGRGFQFVYHLSRLIWGSGLKWDEGDHLAEVAASAGLNLQKMEASIVGQEADLDRVIEANGAALTAAGHWGIPTAVFLDEPFFGQDRIELLVWRMRQHGLTHRHEPSTLASA
ncbi:DsbA family protein [Bradyrhizobium sp. NAS80.1]|uniref:2-hydroxychromene-2-carboxylate isomerase n=1 Tax=Bradyrhizobium sp. NAS80.1 TaxID=1680159 RepID=UPI000A015C47|nr:DsbA family protein [Bradyrhizobium sp. NAS80.1]